MNARVGDGAFPVRQKEDYEAAKDAWRDEELTQISVSWIVAGVFVRFLEDNELIDVPFLAGGRCGPDAPGAR